MYIDVVDDDNDILVMLVHHVILLMSPVYFILDVQKEQDNRSTYLFTAAQSSCLSTHSCFACHRWLWLHCGHIWPWQRNSSTQMKPCFIITWCWGSWYACDDTIVCYSTYCKLAGRQHSHCHVLNLRSCFRPIMLRTFIQCECICRLFAERI